MDDPLLETGGLGNDEIGARLDTPRQIVDKKLGGVGAVQTLSRLNRTHPEKKGTMVLDFANESNEIKAAFEPYYATTLLSEATDPNLLYEVQARLAAFPVDTDADVQGFARVYFDPKATQDSLYAVLGPIVERFEALSKDEQHEFRSQLTDYTRLYAFLAQILTFADADLEKLYVFARHLRRLLPGGRVDLPREVQQNIDMESYRIQQIGSGRVALERRPGVLDPVTTKSGFGVDGEELETLSRIKHVTHAVLKTVAAFLNTEGGDLLIGVADDGTVVGIERDQLDTDDKFMRHLAQVVRNGLGDRAATCIDPKTQIVQGRTVCAVRCQRSPEPVFLKWKCLEANAEGDFFVRSGPGSVKLPPESTKEYIRTRFVGVGREQPGEAPQE